MSLLLILRLFPSIAGQLLLQAIEWLVVRPIRLVLLSLAGLSLFLWIALGHARDLADDRRDQASAWHGKFTAQKSEMLKLVALVRAARVEAARADQANNARVQAEWDAQLSEVTHDYQAELVAARADLAVWMRRGAGETSADGPARSGGKPVLPANPALPGSDVRAGPTATLDEAEADAVTDNTLRLEHLIDAWTRAAMVNVSGDVSNGP